MLKTKLEISLVELTTEATEYLEFFFFFETCLQYIAGDDLEFLIPLPPFPRHWNYKHDSPVPLKLMMIDDTIVT